MKRIFYTAVGIGILTLATIPCASQVRARRVYEFNPRFTYPNRPVTIVGRQLGQIPFEREAEIRSDKTWLRDLRLTFKNTSSKTLMWLWVELMIDRQGNLPTQVGIPLEFGRITVPLDPNGKLIPHDELKPGDTVQLSLSDRKYEYWMKYLASFDAGDFDHVSVQIRYANFNDGTGWAVGQETRQNPNDLDEWIVATRDMRSEDLFIQPPFVAFGFLIGPIAHVRLAPVVGKIECWNLKARITPFGVIDRGHFPTRHSRICA